MKMKGLLLVALSFVLYVPLKGQNIVFKKFKTWAEFIAYQNECLVKVKIGMSKEQVYDSLGRFTARISQTFAGEILNDKIPQPVSRDFWKSETLDIEVIWIYTQTKTQDGILKRDECTPLFFDKNVLIGIGLPMLEGFVNSNQLPQSLYRSL